MTEPTKDKKNKNMISKTTFLVADVLGILLWLGIFVQLFFYDWFLSVRLFLDNYGINSGLIFPIILFFVAILWLLFRNKNFFLTLIYVLFFPCVVIFWKIPKIIFKNWRFVIVFLPLFSFLLANAKVRFFTFSLSVLSLFVIYFSNDVIVLYACSGYIVFYIVRHFVELIKMVFIKTTVFSNVSENIRENIDETINVEKFSPPNSIDLSPEEYKSKYAEGILTQLSISVFFYFLGNKLRDLSNSFIMDILYIFIVTRTFLLLFLNFSFLYYALYKIDPNNFSVEELSNLSDFLVLGLSIQIKGGFSTITPISKISNSVLIFQMLCLFAWVIHIAFIIFSTMRDKYRSDLSSLVDHIEETSKKSERLLLETYETTLKKLLTELINTQPLVGKFIAENRIGKKETKKILSEIDEE